MIFNGDIYHNLIVSCLIGKDQLSAYHCEARTTFLHAHHFTFTYTEFYLPFRCSVTLSCKVLLQLFTVSPFPYCPKASYHQQSCSPHCSPALPDHLWKCGTAQVSGQTPSNSDFSLFYQLNRDSAYCFLFLTKPGSFLLFRGCAVPSKAFWKSILSK